MSDEEKAKLHNKQAVYQRQKRVEAKNKEVRFRNADKIREHWERVQRFDKIVELYGSNYGEYQKKKILENVPKIDVEGFLKEINKGEKDV